MLLFKQVEIPDFDLGVDFVDTLQLPNMININGSFFFTLMFFQGKQAVRRLFR